MKIKKMFSIFMFGMFIVLIYCFAICKTGAWAIDNNQMKSSPVEISNQKHIQKEIKSQESLSEFLKNNNNIESSYTYPSMPKQKVTNTVILPARTPVTLRSLQEISTDKITSGESVKFEVLQDVKDRFGNIIISAGTPATAQIIFAKETGGNMGKAGKLEVSDFHTMTVDGRYIPLSGSLSSQGEDRMVLSIVLSVLFCPLFLLMDGDSAVVPAGTTKTVYTVSDLYTAY